MTTQLRALWIMNEARQVIFSRRFPTAPTTQHPLCSDAQLQAWVEEKVQQANLPEQQFDSVRDYFLLFGAQVERKHYLWPFVVITVVMQNIDITNV